MAVGCSGRDRFIASGGGRGTALLSLCATSLLGTGENHSLSRICLEDSGQASLFLFLSISISIALSLSPSRSLSPSPSLSMSTLCHASRVKDGNKCLLPGNARGASSCSLPGAAGSGFGLLGRRLPLRVQGPTQFSCRQVPNTSRKL